MKKNLILFSLILLLGASGCSMFGGEMEELDLSDITSEGSGMEDFDALTEDEVIVDRDLTIDDYSAIAEDSANGFGSTAAGECSDLAGEWILNTYTTEMTSTSGSIIILHNNSGKTMVMKSDCTYVEDYSTEGFVPARMVQSFTDRGIGINSISALLNGVAAEDIVCTYSGENTGRFVMKPSNSGNSVTFTPNAANQISGSCSPNVAGAMKIDGSHYTPGIGNTAVKTYNYVFNGDTLTLRSHFAPQIDTSIDLTVVYTK